MEMSELLRGTGRGLTADIMGGPVDLATIATNLLLAGGGYGAHKLGLIDQPPDLIDPKTVPFSSDWLAKGTPLEGQGAAYDVGRVLPALLALGNPITAGKIIKDTVGKAGSAGEAVRALRGPGKAQQGALYPGGSDKYALWHETTRGTKQSGSGGFDSIPREIRHPSLMVQNRERPTFGHFGDNILVPRPQQFEGVNQNTRIMGSDFWTPRWGATFERGLKDVGNNKYSTETIVARHPWLRERQINDLVEQLNPQQFHQYREHLKELDKIYGQAFEEAISSQEAYHMRRIILARLLGAREFNAAIDQSMGNMSSYARSLIGHARRADKDLARNLKSGSQGERASQADMPDLLRHFKGGYKKDVPKLGEAAIRGRVFDSWGQWAADPQGAARLRNRFDDADPMPFTGALARIRNEHQSPELARVLRDMKFEQRANPDTLRQLLAEKDFELSPAAARRMSQILSNKFHKQYNLQAAEYGEAKRYGAVPVTGDNFAAFLYGRDGNRLDRATMEMLRDRQVMGIDVGHMRDAEVFDLIEKLNSAGHRGKPNPFQNFEHVDRAW